MEIWKVELTVGGQAQADVKILRRIFQGDSFSLLLFVIAIILLRKAQENTILQENIDYLM